MKLREIATLLKAETVGDDTIDIQRAAKIEDAGEGDITFLANPKYNRFLGTTRASAVLVSRTHQKPDGDAGTTQPALLRVEDPYASFLRVLQTLYPPKDPLPPGIHPTAIIHPSAVVGRDARMGAYVVIGAQCRIGDGAMVCSGVILADGVEIGAGTLIHPHVTVREGCRIGSNVIVHSGTVVGSDGFGFAPRPDGSFEKIPQLGIVVIEDDVEIGANCAIDRATIGETVIRKGAKLDNLIQVAHNVVIGENTVIAAQTGISGSTKIGRNNMIGGQVGFTGHIEIADNTKIGAQSGVHRSVKTPGQTLFGYPAYPHREAMRMQGAITQLPDLRNTVIELKKTIERLEKEIHDRKT